MYFNRICLLLVLFGVIYVHGDDGVTEYTAGREGIKSDKPHLYLFVCIGMYM